MYDAVDYRDFKPTKKRIYRKACFYSGSFTKGKGVEIISKVAKILPDYKFHLYGNIDTIGDKKFLDQKNIFLKGFLTYSKLVNVIDNYKVLMMPYQKKVGVLIFLKQIDRSNAKLCASCPLFKYGFKVRR